MIRFSSHEIHFILKEKAKIRYWVKTECAAIGKEHLNLDFIFCTDLKLLEINKAFLRHHYFTDIITFDYTPPKRNIIAGEMWISIDRVLENAAKYNVDFQNELLRVMIHGVFHLLGFGDKTNEEASKMRHLENQALRNYYKL